MKTKKKAKRSRKASRSPKAPAKCRFNMEVSPAEMKTIRRAAKGAGMTMSAWVRLVLRAAAK